MERATSSRPAGFEGTGPLAGVSGTFGGEAVAGNPLNEAGAFTLTSDLLPADRFPLFAGEASSRYTGAATPNPFGPVEGDRYAAALSADASYQRLGRAVDLTGVAAADAPTLRMKLSFERAGLAPPRDRRGGPVRHRRVDDPARPRRAHLAGAAHAVRGRRVPGAAPVPVPLPDPGRWPVHPHGDDRCVERLHRRVEHLGGHVIRPVGLRRPAGRREGELPDGRQRGRALRGRPLRRRHAGHHRGGHARRRRLRGGRDPAVDRRGPAAGRPTRQPGRLRGHDRTAAGGVVGHDRGHRAARLRPRIAGHAARIGPRCWAGSWTTCCHERAPDIEERV